MGEINVYEFEPPYMLKKLIEYDLAGKYYGYVFILRKKKISTSVISDLSKDLKITKEKIIEICTKYNIKVRTRK